MKALQKLHAPAVAVTREGLWTKLYTRRLKPEEAAEHAATEYNNSHRPKWTKKR